MNRMILSENPRIFATPRRSRKTTEATPKAITKQRLMMMTILKGSKSLFTTQGNEM
jgi:hypothetical protein